LIQIKRPQAGTGRDGICRHRCLQGHSVGANPMLNRIKIEDTALRSTSGTAVRFYLNPRSERR